MQICERQTWFGDRVRYAIRQSDRDQQPAAYHSKTVPVTHFRIRISRKIPWKNRAKRRCRNFRARVFSRTVWHHTHAQTFTSTLRYTKDSILQNWRVFGIRSRGFSSAKATRSVRMRKKRAANWRSNSNEIWIWEPRAGEVACSQPLVCESTFNCQCLFYHSMCENVVRILRRRVCEFYIFLLKMSIYSYNFLCVCVR